MTDKAVVQMEELLFEIRNASINYAIRRKLWMKIKDFCIKSEASSLILLLDHIPIIEVIHSHNVAAFGLITH